MHFSYSVVTAAGLTGSATSASVGCVGRRDLSVRPLLREGELLDLDVSFTRADTLDVPDDRAYIQGALEDDSRRAGANSLLNLDVGYRLGGARLDISKSPKGGSYPC